MSAADRIAYAEYVAGRLRAFHVHAGDTARVWDYGKALAHGRGTKRTDADAFKGPWRVVRPYVTTEFREWIDEHDAERLTFAEWQAVERAARAKRDAEEVEYIESAAFFTDELRRWAELTRDRDALIVAARERGATFRELQDATGLSRMTLHTVISADARRVAMFEGVAA